MKLLKCISFFFCLSMLSVGFTSCGGDDDDDVDLGDAPYEGISGKYSVTTGSSKYQSIELGASGNYIIELNQNVPVRSSVVNESTKHSSFLRDVAKTVSTRSINGYIIYGKYTKDGNVLNLENFGKLEIVYEGDIVAGFKLTPLGEGTVSLEVEKEEQLENDALNNQLCRTWNIVSIRDVEYVNGRKTYDNTMTPENPYAPNDDDEMEEITEFPLQVLFSKAGTYLVYYKDGTIDMAKWKWRSKSDKTVNYGWGDGWDNDEWCTLSFSGNRMTVIEDDTETYDGVTERYYSESVLVAVN